MTFFLLNNDALSVGGKGVGGREGRLWGPFGRGAPRAPLGLNPALGRRYVIGL